MSFLSNIFSLSTLSTAIPYKKDPGKNRNLNKEPAPRKIFPSTHTLYNLKKKEKKNTRPLSRLPFSYSFLYLATLATKNRSPPSSRLLCPRGFGQTQRHSRVHSPAAPSTTAASVLAVPFCPGLRELEVLPNGSMRMASLDVRSDEAVVAAGILV